MKREVAMIISRKNIIIGLVAALLGAMGLYMTIGSGALAQDRKPASENSSEGLTFGRLGF
jgi:hypothetical protein